MASAVTRHRSTRRLPYLLIAPAGLLMLGFIAYPVLSVFSYSLRHYNPTKPWRNGFAGLDNFTTAFTDDPAEVDGASRLRQFFHITLPHLKDAIILSTLLRAVWEFNNVDLLYTLTGGGPGNSTMTLPLYVARMAVDAKEFGYGSALTVSAFLILAIFSIAYLKLSRVGREAQ